MAHARCMLRKQGYTRRGIHTPTRLGAQAKTRTHTHRQWEICIAFPLQQVFRERASVLRYTYIICLVTTRRFEPQTIQTAVQTVITNYCPLRHSFVVGFKHKSPFWFKAAANDNFLSAKSPDFRLAFGNTPVKFSSRRKDTWRWFFVVYLRTPRPDASQFSPKTPCRNTGTPRKYVTSAGLSWLTNAFCFVSRIQKHTRKWWPQFRSIPLTNRGDASHTRTRTRTHTHTY